MKLEYDFSNGKRRASVEEEENPYPCGDCGLSAYLECGECNGCENCCYCGKIYKKATIRND